uniref:Reverse transcriptase domain-containing protein n=1 Tax=Tanacetum cinerariifolium TaxID=118510 RepID=A0A6L2KK79_TANCI|nr:hypothetical protein [Tanacetum cinerariifolium]GEU52484.1 hypothetical protein [Tanacetum cinerariifolium]
MGSNSESLGYAAFDNEVESNLESRARSEPKCKEMENTCESVYSRLYVTQLPISFHVLKTFSSFFDEIAPTRRSSLSNDENPDITAILANGNGRNNGCCYKAFLACNPRDYDGKGGAVALSIWIEKMESVIENSGCAENQKVKYAANSFINKALIWWNTQAQARGQEAETDKEGGSCKDNKKAKVGKGFVVTAPPRNENVGSYSKCAKCFAYHPEGGPCSLCFNYHKPDHFTRDCWVPVKQVVPVSAVRIGNNQRVCYEYGSFIHFCNTCPKLNRAHGQTGNHLALEGNQNTRNNGNQAKGRAFSVNTVDALQDPNVLTEVANGKKEEVDRITRDYKLELGNSLFTLDLIPLGHGNFDVILGMDWLSKNKAKIVCKEKVVRIPLKSGEILRVQGEHTLGGTKTLMSMRADETELSNIPIVRDFIDVFLEDLSGLPPQRQVEFRIDLVPGATLVAKSPYRLALSKMQELSE